MALSPPSPLPAGEERSSIRSIECGCPQRAAKLRPPVVVITSPFRSAARSARSISLRETFTYTHTHTHVRVRAHVSNGISFRVSPRTTPEGYVCADWCRMKKRSAQCASLYTRARGRRSLRVDRSPLVILRKEACQGPPRVPVRYIRTNDDDRQQREPRALAPPPVLPHRYAIVEFVAPIVDVAIGAIHRKSSSLVVLMWYFFAPILFRILHPHPRFLSRRPPVPRSSPNFSPRNRISLCLISTSFRIVFIPFSVTLFFPPPFCVA